MKAALSLINWFSKAFISLRVIEYFLFIKPNPQKPELKTRKSTPLSITCGMTTGWTTDLNPFFCVQDELSWHTSETDSICGESKFGFWNGACQTEATAKITNIRLHKSSGREQETRPCACWTEPEEVKKLQADTDKTLIPVDTQS